MAVIATQLNSKYTLSSHSVLFWRIAQFAVWLVGMGILFSLLFFPALGLLLFWNILIPLAPALFIVAVGVWRNLCPLATTNLLPRHLGLSKRKKLTALQMGKFNLIGVVALYAIVPMRHALFNSNGLATGLLIISMVLTGVVLGFFYEWKSAWCSGLCPVHPVEKLYGGNVIASVPNAHCYQCMNCVVPCPDSTPNIQPGSSEKTVYHKMAAMLTIGGLPGFVWGWFHVPDEAHLTSIWAFFPVYKMPLIGLVVTLIAWLILKQLVAVKFHKQLVAFFAATAVSCYYWYRIPALFGFGKFNQDGILINFSNILPAWSMLAITICTTFFFFYWLMIRRQNKRSWVIRPQYASKEKRQQYTMQD